MNKTRVYVVLAFFTLGFTIAAGAFALGRSTGHDEAPALERKRQLEQLRKDLEQRARAIRQRDVRIAELSASIDTAHAAYVESRVRVALVDATHARVDGILAELPAPVVQVIERGDSLHVVDSLQIVALEEWGNLWKSQAEGYRIKSELLEQELAAQIRRSRRARIRDVAIAAALGAAGGFLAR